MVLIGVLIKVEVNGDGHISRPSILCDTRPVVLRGIAIAASFLKAP